MAIDVSTLTIEVKSSGIQEATNDLKNLASASAAASAAVNSQSSNVVKLADAQKTGTQAAQQAAAAMNGSTASMSASEKAFQDMLSRRQLIIDGSKKDVLALQATQKGFSSDTIAQAQSVGNAYAEMGTKTAAGAETAKHGTVGFYREILVLGHEFVSGNFSRIPGSMMVLAERSGNLLSIVSFFMNPVTLGIIALGGAAAFMGYQFIQGMQAVSAMGEALKNTNNYVGYTSAQMMGLSIAASNSGTRIQDTATAMTLLAASGKVSGDNLVTFTKVAVQMAKDSGEAIEDVVKELAKMSDGVGKWVDNYQAQHHAFDAVQMSVIQRLQQEGHEADATAYAIKALQETQSRMAEQGQKDMGILKTMWVGWGDAIGYVKDKMFSWGAGDPLGDKWRSAVKNLLETQAAIDKMKANGQQFDFSNGNSLKSLQAMLVTDTAIVQKLQDEIDAKNKLAKDNQALGLGGDAVKAVNDYVKSAPKGRDAAHAQAILDADRDYVKAKESINTALVANEGGSQKQIDSINKASELAEKTHLEALKAIEEQYKVKGKDSAASTFDAQLKALAQSADEAVVPLSNSVKQFTRDMQNNVISQLDGFEKIGKALQDEEAIRVDQYNKAEALADEFVSRQISRYGKDSTEAQNAQGKRDALRTSDLKSIEDYENKINANSDKRVAYEQAFLDADKKTHDSFMKNINEQIKKIEDKAATNDKLASSITAIAIAEKEMQATDLAKSGFGDDMQKKVDELRSEIEALQRLRNGQLTVEGQASYRDQAKKYEDAFNASSKSIEDGLYNAIGRGGSNGFKKLMQDVKSWFARLVLNPIIQPISAFGASIINPNAASAGGVAGAAGSGLSLMGTASNMWGAFQGAGNSLAMYTGQGIAGLGGAIGSETMAGFGMGMQGAGTLAGSTALSMGTAGASAGAMVATAIPYIAAVVAAYALIKSAFSMGDKQLGNQTVTGSFAADGSLNASRNVPWTQSGGWLRSDKSGTWSYNLSNSTAMADGVAYQDTASKSSDSALQKGLVDAYSALKSANTEYAKSLGLTADSIVNRTDTISFALGTTAAETQTNITNAMTAISDSMAAAIAPGLEKYALANEGASATLVRLATALQPVNVLLEQLGQKIFAVGLDGANAAYKLQQAFGGLANMQTAMSTFFTSMYSPEQQLVMQTKQLQDAFKTMGLVMPTSKQGFIDLANSIDLTNDSNKTLYATLIGLSSSFATVIDNTTAAATAAAQASATAIDTLRTNLKTAYDRESSAIQSVITNLTAFITQISAFKASLSLGNLSTLSPDQQYAEARKQFQDTANAAKGGDSTAQSNLTNMAQQFLTISKTYNSATTGYVNDYMLVQQTLDSVSSAAQQQLTVEQQSLAYMNQQVEGITGINDKLQSFQAALMAYLGGGGTSAATAGLPQDGTQGAAAQLAASKAYSAQYGNNAYDYSLAHSSDFTQTGGAAWLENLTTNSQKIVGLYQASNDPSIRNQTVEDVILASTGHGSAYWKAITAMFDAGQHPTTNTIVDGSHAAGADFIPRDNWRANLHRGEMVLPAKSAQGMGEGMAAMVDTMKQVVVELKADKEQRGAVAMATIEKLDTLVTTQDKTNRELAKR
jgi:hypothetical protein